LDAEKVVPHSFHRLQRSIFFIAISTSPQYEIARRDRKNCVSPKAAKHALSEVEGGAKVTGRVPSSRANARDLRKISPGVYPELAEGVEMTRVLSWRFSAINFLEVVLLNIFKVRN
jgi:hypothetical protein